MPAFRRLISETNRDSVEAAGFRTNFERKARERGGAVWRAVYEKAASSAHFK
jgi:hypothetical protein